MAAKTKVIFKSTKVPGIRKNSRSEKYEPLCTFFVGSFDTIEQASRAREAFIRKVNAFRKPKNGLSTAELKRDEVEARKIVAGHLKSAAARASATPTN
jgi:hypothetical protein